MSLSQSYFLLRYLASFVMQFGRDVRLAHAFRSVPSSKDMEDIAEVLDILNGDRTLTPRPPTDKTTVAAAEALLGLTTPPIYTYAGCLHPSLGTIGLVISPTCLPRCIQGVSRCDTGGLAGRLGSFAYLPETEIAVALGSLTCGDQDWATAFSSELASSYKTVRAYITGSLPRFESWDDARAHCISSHIKDANTIPDRRLWTWEVRLAMAPNHTEYEGLVVSSEAFKKLDFLQRTGKEVPRQVKIIRGQVGPTGVHHFHEAATIAALSGRGSI